MTRKSSTNVGLIGIFEKIIRSHPLLYIFFRSIIRFTNIFEKDFDGLKKIKFNKNINIIDVGASDGISAKYFINNLNVNKIICFEPYKKYIRILKKIDKVIVKPYAIGNIASNLKIFFPRYKCFNTKFDLITYAHYEKKLLNHFLNDFIFKKNLYIASTKLKIKKVGKIKLKIDLIKIDTNGFEFQVIISLLNVIKKDLPAIIVEINKDSKKIEKILSKYNYKSFYYSIYDKKFSKKIKRNCTNKYFLQKNHIDYNLNTNYY
jgi:FkbM family methyltransferase